MFDEQRNERDFHYGKDQNDRWTPLSSHSYQKSYDDSGDTSPGVEQNCKNEWDSGCASDTLSTNTTDGYLLPSSRVPEELLGVLFKEKVRNGGRFQRRVPPKDEMVSGHSAPTSDGPEAALPDDLQKVLDDHQEQILPFSRKFAGEVRKLKLPGPPRAPSPPGLRHMVVILSQNVAGHAQDRDRLKRLAAKEPNVNAASKGSKKRCGECFEVMKSEDLKDKRNESLKRREKKCIRCWNSPPPTPKETRRSFRKRYPPLETTLKPPNQWFIKNVPEILVEQNAMRMSVAHLLQEIITSNAIVADEMQEQEYWHAPFWMFELPLLPRHMRFLAEVSLRGRR